MNNPQAFARGFIKAAVDQGIHPSNALTMLKKAGISDLINYPDARNNIMNYGLTDTAAKTGLGALGGLALGGTAGYASGMDKDPQRDHRIRNSILGALAGTGLGAVGGGLYGANKMNNALGELERNNPTAHRLWQQLESRGAPPQTPLQ